MQISGPLSQQRQHECVAGAGTFSISRSRSRSCRDIYPRARIAAGMLPRIRSQRRRRAKFYQLLGLRAGARRWSRDWSLIRRYILHGTGAGSDSLSQSQRRSRSRSKLFRLRIPARQTFWWVQTESAWFSSSTLKDSGKRSHRKRHWPPGHIRSGVDVRKFLVRPWPEGRHPKGAAHMTEYVLIRHQGRRHEVSTGGGTDSDWGDRFR